MRTWLAFALYLVSLTGFAQCAPGIPSAGNPGCVPPNQTNSPYYQGSANPPQPALTVQQPIGEDRWGGVALDAVTGEAGASEGQPSKQRANSGAVSTCEQQGSKDCKVILSYVNQCAAAASPEQGDYVSTATAAELDDAISRATERCSKRSTTCEIIYKKCSRPVRIR